MDRALWLLLVLRLRGWLRRLGRNVTTVRGALLVVLGALVFLPGILSWFVTGRAPSPETQQTIQRYGPLGLALYCLLSLLMASEGALTFSAAEVNFLFSGPLSRRQLLAYKIAVAGGASLLSASFMVLFFHQQAGSFLSALVALMLALLLLQLVPMLLALLANTVGAQAYNRRRKIVLAFAVVAIAVGVYQASTESLGQGFSAVVDELESSPAGRVVLAPFSWFIQAFLARELWPDLLQWAGLCLLVIMILIAIVFLLDAQYLETSAAASERAYARLERMRRGGPAAVPGMKARLRLPLLPSWGGAGTLAWRQLTAALRSPWVIVTALILFGFIALGLLATPTERESGGPEPMAAAAVFLCGMAFFISPMLPFDFRGDIDRIEVLKTFPLPAWRLAVGQLLAPVLLLTAIQWVTVSAAMATMQHTDSRLLLAAAFAPALNFLIFTIDNLLFLWFPTRIAAATPGDLQMLGRQMLLWIAKMMVLWSVALVAGLLGLAAYFLAGQSLAAALATAWLVLTCAGFALVPLIALAFRRFDVARDTPP